MVIWFHNGHKFDFGCASGALAFDGNGWWFEQPWRWIKLLRPEEFTIITKTLTFAPRKGNYVWWKPWTCVRLLPNGGVVNAVGLTNPGYKHWVQESYNQIKSMRYKVIVSIAPETMHEARLMTSQFNETNIVGLQLNVSCPNVNYKIDICQMAELILKSTRHPLIIKLSYNTPYVDICKRLDGKVAAFELINSIPYRAIYEEQSPLKHYGYEGGVSGRPIALRSRLALIDVKMAGIKTPVISGGGIDSFEEVTLRKELGADGFVFGSVFLRKPWLPNQIVSKWRKENGQCFAW